MVCGVTVLRLREVQASACPRGIVDRLRERAIVRDDDGAPVMISHSEAAAVRRQASAKRRASKK
jgi:hypothetical protein